MEYTLKHDVQNADGVVLYPAGHTFKVRRPKARDMVVLGNHFTTMLRVATVAAGREGAKDAPASVDGAPTADELAQASDFMAPDVIEALIAGAATLAGMGDAAGDLEFDDLVGLGTQAFSAMGEAQGGGAPNSGAQQ